MKGSFAKTDVSVFIYPSFIKCVRMEQQKEAAGVALTCRRAGLHVQRGASRHSSVKDGGNPLWDEHCK